jgi:hypothetical protein
MLVLKLKEIFEWLGNGGSGTISGNGESGGMRAKKEYTAEDLKQKLKYIQEFSMPIIMSTNASSMGTKISDL